MLFLVFMAIPIRTSLPYVVVATERSLDDLWLKTKFHTNRSGGKYKPVLIDGRWFVVDIFADEKTISNSNCISKFHYFWFRKGSYMSVKFFEINQLSCFLLGYEKTIDCAYILSLYNASKMNM